eukprot:1146574-Pelagomonas_calceolata.AAC.6
MHSSSSIELLNRCGTQTSATCCELQRLEALSKGLAKALTMSLLACPPGGMTMQHKILQLADTTSSVQQELCLRCQMQGDATNDSAAG